MKKSAVLRIFVLLGISFSIFIWINATLAAESIEGIYDKPEQNLYSNTKVDNKRFLMPIHTDYYHHIASPLEEDKNIIQTDNINISKNTSLQPASTATDYCDEGWAFLIEGKYDQAISSFTSALFYNSYLASAYNGRGWCYYFTEQDNLAISDFSKAIQYNSNYANAYDGRGWCYYRNHQIELAIADFSRAIQLDPITTDQYQGRAACYIYKGEYLLAITDLTKVLQLDPSDKWAYYDRAWCYYMLEQYSSAITDYTQFLGLEKNWPSAYSWRAHCYIGLNNYNLAIADFTSHLQLVPDNSWVYYERGLVYYKYLKNYSNAVADFTSALRLDPDFSLFCVKRAAAYYELGQYAQVIKDCTDAINNYPWGAEAFWRRGWANYKLGYNNEAIIDFNLSINKYSIYDEIKLSEMPLIDFSVSKKVIDITSIDSTKNITRGELCHFLVESLNLQSQGFDNKYSYSDVSNDCIYYSDIAIITSRGIMAGYPDGTFHPEWWLTRGEYAKIIISALNYPILPEYLADPVTDLDDHWTNPFCRAAINAGLVGLYDDGTFKPENVLELDIRGQLLAIIAPGGIVDKKVLWSSSDNTIAEVDQTGHVKGKSDGQVTITARMGNRDLISTCQVKVTVPKIASTVSVVIDNSPASQPQAGINEADIVFEVPVAPGISRFLAIYDLLKFDTNLKIGPVRSAREALSILANNYSEGFAHAGGSEDSMQLISQLPIVNLDEIYGSGEYFYRSNDRLMPHNLYTNTDLLKNAMNKRAGILVNSNTQFPIGSMSGGEAADNLSVKFTPQSNDILFNWNNQTYERYENNLPVLTEDGSKITAQNLVVIYTKQTPRYVTSLDEWVYDVDLVGQGDAGFYRNGLFWKCSWEKPVDGSISITKNGQEIKFASGKVWILIVPDSMAPLLYYNILGGLYDKTQLVQLTSSKAGSIYYTLDGSLPTNNSAKYTSAITVDVTTTIRSIAVDNAGNYSNVNTQTYEIDQPLRAQANRPVILSINSIIGDSKLVANDVVTLTFNQRLENSNGEAIAAIISSLSGTVFANRVNVTAAGGNNINTAVFKLTVLPGETIVLTSGNSIEIKAGQISNTLGMKNNEIIVFTIKDDVDECFIATAVFGSKYEPAVVLLRHFRDQYLLTNNFGTALVKIYYNNSPPIAAYIADNSFLKGVVRALLTPIIALVYLIYHPIVLVILFLLFALIMFKKQGNLENRTGVRRPS